MLFQIHLGSLALQQHLGELLVCNTSEEALAKMEAELEDSLRRIRRLRALGLPVQRMGSELVVESPNKIPGMTQVTPGPLLALLQEALNLPETEVGDLPISSYERARVSEIPVVAPISIGALADAYGRIENHGAEVMFVAMNPIDYADMRRLGAEIAGLPTWLWGAHVACDKEFPVGQVLVLGMRTEGGRRYWYSATISVTR